MSDVVNAAPIEPAKTTDMVVPTPEPAKPANDNSDKGESPKTDAAPPAPPAHDPQKLERARQAARQRAEENQRRMVAQAEANRREGERQQAIETARNERAQREAYQRQLEVLKDPKEALAYLEKIGLPAKTLAARAVEQSTPEARLRAEMEARIEERVSAVQKAHEAEMAKMREEREQVQRFETIRAATQHFVSQASHAENYPAVSAVVALGAEWRDSIVAEARRVLHDAYQKTGYEYSNEEVLSYLESKYSKLVAPNPKDAASKSKDGSDSTQEAPNGSGSQESASASGSRTLTNKASQVKGSLPPDFDTMSDAEQKAILAATYRALRRP